MAAGEAGWVDSGHVTEDLKLWTKKSGNGDLPRVFYPGEGLGRACLGKMILATA